MDSLSIYYNTKTQYRQNNYSPTFKCGLKSLNVFNPISKYMDNYLSKAAEISRTKLNEFSDDIKPYAKFIKIISSKNTEISALDLNPNNSDKYIFFLHGMAQNVTNYQPLYKNALNNNYGVFAVEYRGYGLNPRAKLSEDNFRKDVDAAYKHLVNVKKIKPENIVVIGHSMGGSLATDFASKHSEVNSLILICPVVNASSIGEKFAINKTLGEAIPLKLKQFTEKFKPLNWLYSLRLNTINKMKKNKVPTYIIQSQNDAVTPIDSAKVLADISKKCGTFKGLYILESGGHVVNSDKVNVVSHILKKLTGN